ncbi:MAG TPA: hypothetical protein ACFYD1_06990 [Candidatus Hypogeohydataceae bacterium YC38]|nr:hypothetical protein [Candidatus Brocadiales bacterium]
MLHFVRNNGLLRYAQGANEIFSSPDGIRLRWTLCPHGYAFPGSAGLKPCATQDGDRNLKFKLGRV